MIKATSHKIYFLIFAAILLLALALVAMHLGAVKLSISKAFELFFNPDGSNESFVLHHSRIPRIIAAIVIGGALSLSGALYQGVIGNPLVSPGILGVLSGASFGAILAMVLGFNLLGIELFCFIFGLVAMLFSLFLSFAFDRNKTILMLILGGIICSSFFGAGVSALKILADPYNTLPNIVFWLMGSLAYIKEMPLLIVSAVFASIFALSVLLSRQIDILNLDEESARSLGISVRKMRIVFIVFATLLASSSVALAGMIGWIGLVMPHISRFVLGANHRFMLVGSVLLGALFLLLCDTIARTAAMSEIPIGIITSVFGVIIFSSVLLVSKKRHYD